MEESVAAYLLPEAKIIAGGSITKFLRRKSYNCCCRGNLLLANATYGSHLERFIKDINIPSTNLLETGQLWKICPRKEPSNLQDMATIYDSYLEEALNGRKGKTAQFWMTYAKIVVLIEWMKRAIKINDTLYIMHYYIHFEMRSSFFMTSHHNYVRWMSLYSLDLPNLEASQPDLQKIVNEGGFSFNRTGKSFASVSRLKWLLNKQCKRKQLAVGIMGSTDISTAVNWWIMTASMKSKILNVTLYYSDNSISYDVSKESKASRIRAEQNHLSKF